MEYKILLVKNRYTKKLNLSKYLDWFEKNTPIKIKTEEISTDFDLEFREVTNGTYTGVVATNFYNKLNQYYDMVMLFGNN